MALVLVQVVIHLLMLQRLTTNLTFSISANHTVHKWDATVVIPAATWTGEVPYLVQTVTRVWPTPQPATIIAVAVDILNDPEESAPVPQVSITFFESV